VVRVTFSTTFPPMNDFSMSAVSPDFFLSVLCTIEWDVHALTKSPGADPGDADAGTLSDCV